jgi:integrating conjugative element membrane protein (TIGR03747 family)
MSGPVNVAQRQQAQQQSLIGSLITLPFKLFGVLCGALLLCIAVEAVGMLFFWPQEGWHHAERMLEAELAQIPANYAQSALIASPAQAAHALIENARALFAKSGLLDSAQTLYTRTGADGGGEATRGARDFKSLLRGAYAQLAHDLIAVFYAALVFLVRLFVLFLSLPLFMLAAFTGFVDGLVRRDIRRFGAGHESGFIYHRARASLVPLAVLPWGVYLALPVTVPPLYILLPAAVLLGVAVDIAAGSFKKYL